MKDCTQDLAQHLNEDDEFICCDLFALTLSDGSIYRIADSDKDVVAGGKLYKHNKFLSQREQTKTAGAPSVETLVITVYADREHDDTIAGLSLLQAAHEGKLDDAYISLARAFFDAEGGELLGTLTLFYGRCEVTNCGGLTCKLSAKSETIGLNALVPLRTFAPQNVYQEEDGVVSTASKDVYTCMIPLKPSKNVLVKL